MNRRSALKKTLLTSGSAILAPSLLSLLQSCQSLQRDNWKPEFFNTEQANFVTTLVDLILPKTDTPGALDTKVDLFIDKVFAQMYDAKSREDTTIKLNALMAKCEEKHGKVLDKLSQEEQVAFVKSEEETGGSFNSGIWGTSVGEQKPVSFYKSLKSMTIWGHFSSEEIGKNVLNYNPVPGPFQGCVPLSDIGNSWSV